MTRVLSALALLPIVVGVIWLLPVFWTLVLASVVLVGALREYAGLVARIGAPVCRPVTVVGALATAASVAVQPALAPAVILAATVAAAVWLVARTPGERLFASVAASAFALVYLALPLGAIAALRVEGREVVLLLLATVMASDTLQYYGGRTLGRRPLAPSLSPKKTVEGAVFGVVAAGLVMLLLGRWWLEMVPPATRLLTGVAIGGCGIAGDLFESGLKRTARIKDASALIPGHGGVLDRIDGLVFAVPVYHLVLALH